MTPGSSACFGCVVGRLSHHPPKTAACLIGCELRNGSSVRKPSRDSRRTIFIVRAARVLREAGWSCPRRFPVPSAGGRTLFSPCLPIPSRWRGNRPAPGCCPGEGLRPRRRDCRLVRLRGRRHRPTSPRTKELQSSFLPKKRQFPRPRGQGPGLRGPPLPLPEHVPHPSPCVGQRPRIRGTEPPPRPIPPTGPRSHAPGWDCLPQTPRPAAVGGLPSAN